LPTDEEVAELAAQNEGMIAEIVAAREALDEHQRGTDALVQNLKHARAGKANELDADLRAKIAAYMDFYKLHKGALRKKGTKLIEARSGVVKEREVGKPKVVFEEGTNEAKVLAQLKRLGKLRMTTTLKRVVSKELLAKHPEIVQRLNGVHLEVGVSVYVKPASAQTKDINLEERTDIIGLKKED
jgi:phage host-nuclease inhibitor protein Gam